ncbi:hypothetical protein FCJ61_10035 [Burkholderia metallica]|nr:hypothetical protein [Burkholderia metallica]
MEFSAPHGGTWATACRCSLSQLDGHSQVLELFDLAKANPETKIIVNHCGGVVKVDGRANRHRYVSKTPKQSHR